MNSTFRNRAFLPLMIPLAILAVIGLLAGGFAAILLWNTAEAAVALAIVAAAGILLAASLAASADQLDGPKKGAIAFAGLTPIVVGILFATGVVGNVDPALLNINREPHAPAFLLAEVPADAPVLGATSINAFCLPTNGGCEDTFTWEVPLEDPGAPFTYAFDNLHEGVDHNLVLFALDGDPSDPDNAQAGDLLTPEVPAPFPGIEERAYEFTWPDGQAPEHFYFLCTVHPSTMYGVGTFTS